jgi:endonuclease YncB( thermonuclease family)
MVSFTFDLTALAHEAVTPIRLCCATDLTAYGRRVLRRLIAILTFSRRTECLTGRAKVIDGDTIVVADQLVRLHGIDAPELDQTFQWRGQQIVCGTMSLAALEALIAGVKVRCEVVERDRHGRLVAKVFSPNGVDIGRRLVSAGWAVAYRRYSKDYVDAEAEARKARRGMWRGTFVKPWEWRASSPPRRTPAPSTTVSISSQRL